MRSLSRSVVSPLIRSLFLAEATRRSLAVLAAVVWVAVPGFALALSFSPDTFQLSAQNGTPATELILSDLSNTGDGDISFDLTLSGHVDTLNAVSFVFESMAVFSSGPRSPGAQVEGATLLSAVGITGPTITSNPYDHFKSRRIGLALQDPFGDI